MNGVEVRGHHSGIAPSTMQAWGIELRLAGCRLGGSLEAGAFPTEHLAGRGLCLYKGLIGTVPGKDTVSSLSR